MLLVSKGADINTRAKGLKNSLIMLAVEHNHRHIVKYLGNSDVNINFTDERDRTPLSVAIKNNNLDIVEILVRFGANINPSSGESPLAIAIKRGNEDMIDFFLSEGSDPNGPPLTYAIKLRLPNIINKLVLHGAKINYKNVGMFVFKPRIQFIGISPLEYAVMHGTYEIIKQLLDLCADIDNMEYLTLVDIYEKYSKNYVLLFLDYPCNISIKNGEGQTLLDLATRNNDHEIINKLQILSKQ